MAEHAGSVRRREDPRLITGTGEFVDDFRVPGCLHAAMLRSPHAHARIRSIDVSAARRAPGIVGVFLASDLGSAGVAIPIYAPHPALPVACGIRPLAGERVRFVGEAVAAVIADDPYRAWDALDLIRVEYEPLPALVDMEAALAPGAPVLHEETAGNVVAEWRQRVGDVELFTEHFLRLLAERYGSPVPVLDAASHAWMLAHPWPGNIRELENLLEREFLLAEGEPIIRLSPLANAKAPAASEEALWNYRRARAHVLDEFDRGFLEKLIRFAHGNIALAARTAGKERRDLGRLLQKYAIMPDAFRPEPPR